MSPLNKLPLFLLIAAVVLGSVGTSRAGIGVFMLFKEGGNPIPGESKDFAHKDWIEVLTFSQSFSRLPAAPAPYHGSIVLEKYVDLASPRLIYLCNSGRVNRSVDLELVRMTAEQQLFYSIT